MSLKQHKTDNGNLIAKVTLRRVFLERYHSDGGAMVFDAFRGNGCIWDKIRASTPIKSHWGVDTRKFPGVLRVDSLRIIKQPMVENVYDLDAYGSPWAHWLGLLGSLNHSATVFLTIGKKNTTARPLTDVELDLLGIGKMCSPCPMICCGLVRMSEAAMICAAGEYGFTIDSWGSSETNTARYLAVRLEKTYNDQARDCAPGLEDTHPSGKETNECPNQRLLRGQTTLSTSPGDASRFRQGAKTAMPTRFRQGMATMYGGRESRVEFSAKSIGTTRSSGTRRPNWQENGVGCSPRRCATALKTTRQSTRRGKSSGLSFARRRGWIGRFLRNGQKDTPNACPMIGARATQMSGSELRLKTRTTYGERTNLEKSPQWSALSRTSPPLVRSMLSILKGWTGFFTAARAGRASDLTMPIGRGRCVIGVVHHPLILADGLCSFTSNLLTFVRRWGLNLTAKLCETTPPHLPCQPVCLARTVVAP